jgi:adenosylcobinamide-GDP ribazoletransferase
MKHIRVAFNLLTTLPVRAPMHWQPGDSGRAAGWYPLVGLVIGVLVAGVWLLTNRFLPPLVCAGLALAAWIVITGGLHLDGLADCCDGLFHPSDAERRLAIMKDPLLGAFGAVGLFLALLLKFAALASLAPERAALAIVLAASLGRWVILLAGKQPLARPGGMGADFASGLKKPALAWGAVIPLGLSALLGLHGLLALTAALLAVIGLLRLARARIGGVTGDVFGLLVETAEITSLIAINL